MVKRFRAATLSAVVVSLLAGSTVALAQGPGGPGRQGPRGRLSVPGGEFRGLDLSEAQREQIRTLTQQYRESGQAIRDELRQAQEAQREALAVVPVNDGLIRSTTQALIFAQTETAIAQARLRADVLALLTPDQLQTMEDRLAAREERQQQFQERREQIRERRQQP